MRCPDIYERIRSVPTSKHADGEHQIGVYIPDELRDTVRALLKTRGWTLTAYVMACLLALQADPDAELEAKAPHRPPEKPRGRPPRTDREQQ